MVIKHPDDLAKYDMELYFHSSESHSAYHKEETFPAKPILGQFQVLELHNLILLA